MINIEADNVNGAYTEGMLYLMEEGVPEESRNGKVIVAPEPVCTTYYRPTERVLFSPERDANPFFHLMECLWMMDGRNDAEFLIYFNSRMGQYANDDGTFDGAYGHRWRKHFMFDQITYLVELLKRDPTTRRAVLTMFDPAFDLGTNSKDIPCNTQIYFDMRYNKLNMTVCNRSNDAVWGCYGANAVHFSFLQEVIAGMLDVTVGDYRQFSNNLHFYPNAPRMDIVLSQPFSTDLYLKYGWKPYPVVTNPTEWFQDLTNFMDDPHMDGANSFFYMVARPVLLAWIAHKEKKIGWAINIAESIADPAWQHACVAWLGRRF